MAQTTRPPLLARRLLERLDVYRRNHSVLEDFEETYVELLESGPAWKAKGWYWRSAFRTLASWVGLHVSWRLHMLRNNLVIAYRNLIRHKLFSFINVFGLAVGLGVCMMIGLWVLRETGYDRFHAKAGRIFRVERELVRDDATSRWPITGALYKQALIDEIPEVENAARFWGRRLTARDHKNLRHRQRSYAADNSVFEIFDFGLEAGDPNTALTEPMTAVMTAGNAVKYFGTADAVGRALPVEWNGTWTDFKVTGILKNVPDNSHIRFDMLISMASFPEGEFEWRSNYLYTYVLLKEGASRRAVGTKLEAFVERHLIPVYGDLLGHGGNIPNALKMHLFPVTGIHLRPCVTWEAEPGGSLLSVTAFSLVAVLILALACLNFVNLSTARAGKRAKEVGLRKTVGAGKGQLRRQFLHESLMLTAIALGIAFVLIEFFVRAYNRIFSGSLSSAPLFEPRHLAAVLGTAFVVGILAGLYPAFYLTRFEPAGVLKGGSRSGRANSRFRRNLVVIQFGASIVIIIGMFTVSRQMDFIRGRSLGFDRTDVVLLEMGSPQAAPGYESFRNELRRDPLIIDVASSADAPGDSLYGDGAVMRQDSVEPIRMIHFLIGYDYVETMKMSMAAGRPFSRRFVSDASGAVLLNEAAVRRMGWTPEEAIGKKLVYGSPRVALPVVGVVKNFNYKSLREEVEPAFIRLDPGALGRISIRIKPGDEQAALRLIRKNWERAYPENPFQYEFLDARMERLYEGEKNMRNFCAVFSFLAVLISCLGLLGLVSFTAEEKTREIGIRKVLGASTSSILVLLSGEFVKWIVLANLLAWPLAWFIMKKWLDNFAFRTDIGWTVFVLTGLITMGFGIVTFIVQTAKASAANPSETMRYE